MAKYTGTILTNKGKELLVRAILGEVIVFTKVEIGKGILPLGTDKENLTSLIDSFKILSITSTTNLPNGGYRIRISFNNKGFIDDTYLREVGIYARGEDGIEILYSYCNTDTPNLIPNEASGIIESVEDIITYISNAATINAVIDQSNVYATIKDLVEGLATKEDKFNKNGAFNKSFGTIIGTVMEGNKRATDLGGEVAFNKNSGFNKNKSDVVNSDDSNTIATSKAVKIAYDRGSSGVTKAANAQNSANSAQTKANQAYTLADGKEPKFNKGNAFNKSFGTTTGTVMEGNKRATDLGGEAAFNKKDAFNRSFSHVINSTSKILVASAYAVKLAYDRGSLGVTNASTAKTKADSAYNLANGKEPAFTKNNGFNRVMTNLVTSTSTILVASAAAVRTAYNKGLEALGLTVINKNAIQNNTEQIENLFANDGYAVNGYKWVNGLLIQWGEVYQQGNTNTGRSYNIPFPNSVFIVVGNSNTPHVGAGSGNNASAYKVNNSTFRTYSDDGNYTVSWFAIGF